MRLLFVVLVISFGVWGVGDVIRMVGHDTWAARVGDRTIEAPELQEAYQRQLAQVTRMMRGQAEPTPEVKHTVLNQALDRMILEAAVAREERRLGIAVTDDALRLAVYEVPAFRGSNGQFEMNTFQAALRNAGLSEARCSRHDARGSR